MLVCLGNRVASCSVRDWIVVFAQLIRGPILWVPPRGLCPWPFPVGFSAVNFVSVNVTVCPCLHDCILYSVTVDPDLAPHDRSL